MSTAHSAFLDYDVFLVFRSRSEHRGMNPKTECLKMHVLLEVYSKKINFFFSVHGGTVFGGGNIDSGSRIQTLVRIWCSVPSMSTMAWMQKRNVWKCMYYSRSPWKNETFFFCPWWDGFWDVRTFSDQLFGPGKKNDHFSTFLEKKKFLKNCFLSMIPAPKCTER